MTDQLKLIHAELVRIREALEARPYAVNAPTHKAVATQGKTDEIPLPTEVIADAGSVKVHFGKNKGVSLSALSDRSAAWYAQEPEPSLDSSGKPFPTRAEDVLLRNAARTMIHQKRGTLAGAAVQPPKPSTPAAPIGDEEVPF